MSTLRERLNYLKKKKHIKSDAELLKSIYQDLYKNGSSRTRELDEDEFVRKAKGSFSSMVDEKRAFDQDYFLSLERILDTSMLYLIDGKGGTAENTNQRGLYFAATTDTRTNYQTLIDEGVYMEQDEYQYTLLDYMIENDSRNGFEFFAERGELPINEIGMYTRTVYGLNISQSFPESLIKAVLSFCKPETALKYLNGYYFVEKASNPDHLDADTRNDLEVLASLLSLNRNLRIALSDYRSIPLSVANPTMRRADGKPLGEGLFANFFLNEMVQTMHPDIDHGENEEHPTRELFEKAIEINKITMAAILGLGCPSYRVDDCGFVYSGGMLCGSIVNVPGGPIEGMDVFFSQKTIDVYNELCEQVREFKEKITEGSRVSVDGGIMRVQKQESQAFYDFYRLMREANAENVAIWLEGESVKKDAFRLPEGKQQTIGLSDQSLLEEAIGILKSIDALSESSLGEGKTYAFPRLTNRSFFVSEGQVTGIAPTEVRIGGRYDNLAEIISETCLSIPQFYSADGMVRSVANSLKCYGVCKAKAKDCLKLIANYYRKSAEETGKKDERGKMIIASKCQRALWIDLYLDELVEQFK